jgi:hypothetical protein
MRTCVEFILWLNNERDCFSPEFCLLQGKRFTEFVLPQQGQLSVGVCGSAGLHIRTTELFSSFFRCSLFSEKGWFRLKRSRYRNYRLYSQVFNRLQR